ncbi:hypothetical protein DFJ73DRAFT_956289 [Zopfochytrium polystomum]|nr:hypothetical protein DFJ73DRAFT_956289 [Zopfochytrium polystomum]
MYRFASLPAARPAATLVAFILLHMMSILLPAVRAANVLEVLQGISGSNFTVKQMAALLTNTSISIPTVRTALSSSSSVTLFAFTDAAYENLAKNTLLSDYVTNADALAGVLMYHVAPSSLDITNSSLPAKTFLKTMLSPDNMLNQLNFDQNQVLIVQKSASGVLLATGTQTVSIVGSYSASNGFVYVVDAMILPPASIVSTYKGTLGLSGYSNFINAATITSQVNALNSITAFIPSNAGLFEFQNLNQNLTLTSDIRAAVVECHIIPGIYYSTDLAKLAGNTAITTYLQNATLTVKNGTAIAANPTSTQIITITTPDILIDSGVVHIVSSFFLADIIAASKLPSPLPTISQIYPAGYGPIQLKPGKDFPFWTVFGSVLAGVVVIAVGICLFLIIRRRRRILQHQKELEEEEAQYEEYDDYIAEEDEFEDDTQGGELETPRMDSADLSEATTAAATPDTMEQKPNSKRNSKRSSKRVSLAPGVVAVAPSGKPEDDDDDDDEEEDDEDVKKAMAEARRIMNYRRSQWSNGDSRRSSSAGPKRESVISESGKSSGNRRSVVSSKRLSQLPLPEVADPKEKKRENVRNSWWSATGVGAGVNDPAVLEAQARREDERRSWWSGDGTPGISSSSSDKRRSVVSNAGSRSGNDTPDARRRSVLTTDGKRRSVVEGDARRRSAIDPDKRRSTVVPDFPDTSIGKHRSMTGGSRPAADNRSWWSAATPAAPIHEEPLNDSGFKVIVEDENGKRMSALGDKRKSRVSFYSKHSVGSAEGDSALAIVVGGGSGSDEKPTEKQNEKSN